MYQFILLYESLRYGGGFVQRMHKAPPYNIVKYTHEFVFGFHPVNLLVM